jgi:hypothetical protein
MTHPTLKETGMALAGLAILYLALAPMLLAGNAELAFLIYVFQQVMK